jgi:hypothetical protein
MTARLSEESIMSFGQSAYLIMVIARFSLFGLVLFVVSLWSAGAQPQHRTMPAKPAGPVPAAVKAASRA